MPVFKAFFKILKVKGAIVLIYVAAFIAFMFGITLQSESAGESMFQTKNLYVAVWDKSRSALSDRIIQMLQGENEVSVLTADDLQKLGTTEKEQLRELNDDVRYGVFDYVLIFPETFEDDDQYSYFSTSDSSAGYIISEQIDTFLKCLKINMAAGMDGDEALEKAAEVSDASQNAEIRMADFSDEGGSTHDSLYYLYRFMCYSVMMAIVIGICTVMTGMKNDDLVRRIHCSALSSQKISLARFSASLLFAVGVMGLFVLIASIYCLGSADMSKNSAYILNLVPVVIMSAAFAYLLSTLTADESIINMITNMVSLAMSFMCGVFIEQNMMQPGVLKAAQFMPFYWYVHGVDLADASVSVTSPAFLQCIGIQLLFAAAFAAAGIVISRSRAAGK